MTDVGNALIKLKDAREKLTRIAANRDKLVGKLETLMESLGKLGYETTEDAGTALTQLNEQIKKEEAALTTLCEQADKLVERVNALSE